MSNSKLKNATIFLLFISLLFFGLVIARGFLVPLFVAIIFAYLLYPLTSFLEKKKFKRVFASILGIFLLFSIIIVFFGFVFAKVHQILAEGIDIIAQSSENLRQMELFVLNTFGISIENQNLWLNNLVSNLMDSSNDFSKRFFTATAQTLFQIGMIPVFIFYFLQYREKFGTFIYEMANERHKEITEEFLKTVSFVTPRYIGGVFMVVSILAVINSVGLLIIGLKYAVFFGVISAIFNFIPYFGTWIGAAFPILFALLTSDSPTQVLYVILLFVVVQFTENNILTPNITGSYVNINPLFTILGIMLGGVVWGIAGMFVVIPIMATLKIYCDFFPNLQPIGRLLGTPTKK
ncbi:MAG: AI-2E family transporter [Bacteroidetes bacterium 4572_77]|nr:MAG: AI-2E family transporter [Bacteroidetes bacterium 4572_77]